MNVTYGRFFFFHVDMLLLNKICPRQKYEWAHEKEDNLENWRQDIHCVYTANKFD